jgi:cytoskeletal protein RodZ
MTLGSMIEEARQAAGFSLAQLASATNIRATVLSQIEKDDFSNCGGHTYARGHIRNIAIALKADQAEFLRVFDEEQGIEARTMSELLVENSIMQRPNDKPKISLKSLLIISIACLGIAGVMQIVLSNISMNQNATPRVEVSESSSPITTESPNTTTTSPSEQSTFSTGTGVSVILNAVRNKSWIFVSDASGRTLFSGEISQGEVRTFTSDQRLDLKVGNAGGVDLEVNGKSIDPIGANGQVVSVSFGVDS